MFETYLEHVHRLLDQVKREEETNIIDAATKIADCIDQGGIVHLFGCGHSHMLGEELFYRAGGLAPVRVIFHEPLMLHEGAVSSSQNERENDYAHTFMGKEDIRPHDVVIVISTSGKNPVPVDVAMISKEKGAYVIGLTSSQYQHELSRHHSGKLLCHVVDLVLDNHIPKGDAMMKHASSPVSFGSASTIVGAAILNSIFIEVTDLLIEKGYNPPPVFISGNINGADEHNEQIVKKYKDRIPLLS
ncbi:SIS domain-containing protein [Shimazuella kribbensis]|uniref:SIS domain-containing protein n=1 Tax=Shimazuella kribbensis TaxID=139808 RepID=UPI000426F47D|nr:SIS domain-containing protein [Shimazuella kribbensis]